MQNADDARLRYTITAVTIITEDFNPPLLTGPAPLVGQVAFELVGLDPQEFYRVAETASVFDANDHFFYEAACRLAISMPLRRDSAWARRSSTGSTCSSSRGVA
jgi:hypothetical protein